MAKYLPVVVRVLLGGMFCMTGLNGFVHFMALPPPTGPAATLFGGFAASGYMLPLIFGTQLTGGLLVLSGRLTPLGLTLLAPVLVNILAFHVFLEHKGLGTALVLTVFALFLVWAYRAAFVQLLASPASSRAPAAAVQQAANE